jgi:hypothetical protein
MSDLTHFQEIVAMALDLDDEQASRIQKGWPQTEEALRKTLRQWKIISGSSVKGYELLSAVGVIWRHKPTDLAEVEGRPILYHPIDGTPIPENSPLDGLDWQMLAFFRWSYQKGYLSWSDEVAIVREAKQAGAIEALPSDRFYAKSMLPRGIGGAIDWSALSLARAKSFVTAGVQSTLTKPLVEPVYYDDNSLVGILASIPSLGDRDTRTFLLKGLPAGPVSAIRRSPAPGTDLANIVEACEGFGELSNGQMAVNVIIQNAKRLVRGTTLETKLTMHEV